MGHFVMMVQSQPLPGREEDYHRWYDEQHMGDVTSVPGIVSGRRYNALTTSNFPGPDARYMVVYQIEADDVQAVMAEFERRAGAGELPLSDSLDMASVKLWLFEGR